MISTEPSTMESRPSLGVIILNYNYAGYVKEAIESVLGQTSPFDAFCVVDDGSTDHSVEVIGRYAPPFTLVRKTNGGQMSATLAGLERVTTDYIYILDADDFLAPSFVERIRPHLPGAPAKLQCQLIGVDADGKPIDSIFPGYPQNYHAGWMLEDNANVGFYICPPTTGNIYRRDFLRQLDLASVDPRVPLDGPGALLAPYFGPVVTLVEPLAYYRVHASNFGGWSKPTQKTLEREVKIFYGHWRDACRLSGQEQPAFGKEEPLYVLERRLMMAGLAGEPPGRGVVRAMQQRIVKTHFPLRNKIALCLWAALFLLPSVRLRRYLVQSRRSAADRPRILKRLLRFLRGK